MTEQLSIRLPAPLSPFSRQKLKFYHGFRSQKYNFTFTLGKHKTLWIPFVSLFSQLWKQWKQICLLVLCCRFLHLPERQLIPQLMIRKVSTFLRHCPSFFQREGRFVGEAEDIKQRHLHKTRAGFPSQHRFGEFITLSYSSRHVKQCIKQHMWKVVMWEDHLEKHSLVICLEYLISWKMS